MEEVLGNVYLRQRQQVCKNRSSSAVVEIGSPPAFARPYRSGKQSCRGRRRCSGSSRILCTSQT